MAGLRNGFTTGSAATAAAMAAARLAFKKELTSWIDIPLPPFGKAFCRLAIPVERAGLTSEGLAFAEVRKDGGDDPDATHGMIIRADLYANDDKIIEISGGDGIGRVTLPGLPVEIGQPAINPVPKAQIAFGVAMEIPPDTGLRIVISAPEGRERARQTMNERLGVIGGISILGTQGIVRPYSNAAYMETIRQAVEVARSSQCEHLCFATGRRSLQFLTKLYSAVPPQSFIVAGDFVQESLSLTKDFTTVAWGCFFGKLIKLAQGLPNTHAHIKNLDSNFLAAILDRPEVCNITTAQSVFDIAKSGGGLNRIAAKAKYYAEKFAGRQVTLHVFDSSGREMARV